MGGGGGEEDGGAAGREGSASPWGKHQENQHVCSLIYLFILLKRGFMVCDWINLVNPGGREKQIGKLV